jgi:molybdopterin/thiamine biosynthesis adenylyltransferase
MTLAEGTFEEIKAHVFKDHGIENAGFAFSKLSRTSKETRLIVSEFIPVRKEHVLDADGISMRIDSQALVKAMAHAETTDQLLIFVHSHPAGYGEFSPADDRLEADMFKTVYIRNGGDSPHASLILPDAGTPRARVWLPDGQMLDIDRIRVIGQRFSIYDRSGSTDNPAFFERQVAAFGIQTQSLLRTLHVAVVGAGGTGSATVEQLIRLGVRELSIYDGQALENSNVTRVFGSRSSDLGMPKVEILARHADEIGLGTIIHPYASHITEEATAKSLRDADLIFGCTDDEFGRSILNGLAYRYFIPVIDMGVKITSEDGLIRSVDGRVTVISPGTACLFCRQHISPDRIKAEQDQARRPEEAEKLRKEGYAPELKESDPSVVPFTASISAQAVCELLHRLTGFMGAERRSTEVLMRFDQCEIRTNADSSDHGCFCETRKRSHLGDTRDFLGVMWP